MTVRILAHTPWVREALNADPVQAMEIEALTRRAPIDGSLRISGKSARGPWLAIVNTPETGFDGHRGTGRRVVDAVAAALKEATA